MPQDPLVMMADTFLRLVTLEGTRAAVWAVVWFVGGAVPFTLGWHCSRRWRERKGA